MTANRDATPWQGAACRCRGAGLRQLFDRPLAPATGPSACRCGPLLRGWRAAQDGNGHRLTRGFEPVCAIGRVAPARVPT